MLLSVRMPDEDTTPLTPEQRHDPQRALFDLGVRSSTQPTFPRDWRPPSVEELQRHLPLYEIIAFVARGGMGAVYKGTQKALMRTVAIKVLPPEAKNGDLHFAARFKREAQAMAQLSHSNIVTVHDAGETAGGLLYFVMEFMEGTDVARLIETQGCIDPSRAIEITHAVCDALAFAHEQGIIHRDIKPSNVMIDQRGRVKVADFGLAKAINLESAVLTRSDVVVGTADFMAPEILIPGVKLDGRADLYAMGVMLYQMLTGRVPRGRFERPSKLVPRLSPRVDAIVDKAMQSERDKRYSTAQEMQTALTGTAPALARGRRSIQPSEAPIRRFVKKPVFIGIVTALVAGAIWIANHRANHGNIMASTEAATSRTKAAIPSAESNLQLGDNAKANLFWKSLWSKPGRLHAAGVDTEGKPFDLTAAAPYLDVVQVCVLDRTTGNNHMTSWLALRSNGDRLGEKNMPLRRGMASILGSDHRLTDVNFEGYPSYFKLPVPSVDYTLAPLEVLPDHPTITAFQDVRGSWYFKEPLVYSWLSDITPLNAQPKVVKVIVKTFGVGVLRADGSLRAWCPAEVKLPAEVSTKVADVVDIGQGWAVLRNDGQVFYLAMKSGISLLRSQRFEGVKEIRSAGYGIVMKLADGRWTSGSPGVVEDTLTKLFKAHNESFSVFRETGNGETREGIMWIEPAP